MISSFM